MKKFLAKPCIKNVFVIGYPGTWWVPKKREKDGVFSKPPFLEPKHSIVRLIWFISLTLQLQILWCKEANGWLKPVSCWGAGPEGEPNSWVSVRGAPLSAIMPLLTVRGLPAQKQEWQVKKHYQADGRVSKLSKQEWRDRIIQLLWKISFQFP